MIKILLLLALSFNLAAKEKIVIAADIWLPYSGEPSKLEGFMVDIAKEIFKRSKIDVEYINKPWERVVKEVIEGKLDAAVGSNNRDIPPEHAVLPEEEQAIESFDFFTHPDSTWKYEGVNSLNGHNVATTGGYTFGEEIDKKLEDLKNEGKLFTISGENPLFTAINLLEKKRVNIYLDNKFVVFYSLKHFGKEQTTLRLAGNSPSKDPRLYVAFSKKKKSSEKYAKILSDGMKKIRKDGTLKKIMAKYGLTDWKK